MDDEAAVRQWLRHLKLEKYADVLLNNEFDTLHAISEITETDLSSMNINKIGARRKLLSAAARLREGKGLPPTTIRNAAADEQAASSSNSEYVDRRLSSQSLPVETVADPPPVAARNGKSAPGSASPTPTQLASRQREADRVRKLQERMSERQRELEALQTQLVEDKARAIVKEREVLQYLDSQPNSIGVFDRTRAETAQRERLDRLFDQIEQHEQMINQRTQDLPEANNSGDRPPSSGSFSAFALSMSSTGGPPPRSQYGRVPSAGLNRPQSVPPPKSMNNTNGGSPAGAVGGAQKVSRPASASGQRAPHRLQPLGGSVVPNNLNNSSGGEVREAIETELFPPISSVPGYIMGGGGGAGTDSRNPSLSMSTFDESYASEGRRHSIGNEDPTEFINAILTHLDGPQSPHGGGHTKAAAHGSAMPPLSPLEMSAHSQLEAQSVILSKDQLIGITERGNNSLANAADAGMEVLTDKIKNRDEFASVLRKFATPSQYALTGLKSTGDSPMVSFRPQSAADSMQADGQLQVLVAKADYRKLLGEQERQHAQLQQCDKAYRKMLDTFNEQQEYMFSKLEALASPVHGNSLFNRPKTLLEDPFAC